MKKRHVHWSDLHGYSRLVIDATLGVTDLVEAMHLNILQFPAPFATSRARRGPTASSTKVLPCPHFD